MRWTQTPEERLNPAHLFVGTHSDNMRDMMAKGRACKGSSRANAKLRESDIPVIRALITWSGFTQEEVAAEYGVTRQRISAVVRGKIWRHVQ